jgi:hypothetical protein
MHSCEVVDSQEDFIELLEFIFKKCEKETVEKVLTRALGDYICIYTRVCVCVFVYVYICMYISVCVQCV